MEHICCAAHPHAERALELHTHTNTNQSTSALMYLLYAVLNDSHEYLLSDSMISRSVIKRGYRFSICHHTVAALKLRGCMAAHVYDRHCDRDELVSLTATRLDAAAGH